jgi:hypothetical protein
MNLKKFDISRLAICGRYENDYNSIKTSIGPLVYKRSKHLSNKDIDDTCHGTAMFHDKVALYINDLAIEVSDNSSSDDDSSSSNTCSISYSDDSSLSLLDNDSDTEADEKDSVVSKNENTATTTMLQDDIDRDDDEDVAAITTSATAVVVAASITEAKPKEKKVRFSHVGIQEYAVTVGTIGCFQSDKVIQCPLQLCWEHTIEKCYPIDQYERKRYKAASAQPRSTSSSPPPIQYKNKNIPKRIHSTKGRTAAALATQQSIFDMSEMFDFLSEEITTCQMQRSLSSSSSSGNSDVGVAKTKPKSPTLPCPRRLSLKERRKRISAVQMISIDQVKLIDKLQRQTRNHKTSSSGSNAITGDDKKPLLLLSSSAISKASVAIQQWYYCSV